MICAHKNVINITGIFQHYLGNVSKKLQKHPQRLFELTV